jgi:DUF3006 family protein
MTAQTRTWVVDAVEEGVAAVHEDGARLLHVPAWLLPGGAREGDVLSVTRTDEGGAAVVRLAVDRAATEAALRRSREQVERRVGNDPGGDIVL